LKKNPSLIAEDLVDFIKTKNFDLIEEISSLNAFLNIKINKNIFTKQFLEYLKNNDFEELKKKNNDKTIVIDYI
jgi:arginyl-tRNA synthetase